MTLSELYKKKKQQYNGQVNYHVQHAAIGQINILISAAQHASDGTKFIKNITLEWYGCD